MTKKIIEGILSFQKIKWTIPKKKTIQDIHKIGDIVFVKKEKFLAFKTISKS